MALLSTTRTISDSRTSHVSDHNALHVAYNKIIPVEAFGAVGDGVNDDTAALQAAFDAGTSGGTAVALGPNARYKTSSQLTIVNDNFTLIGWGCGERVGNTQVGVGSRIEPTTAV